MSTNKSVNVHSAKQGDNSQLYPSVVSILTTIFIIHMDWYFYLFREVLFSTCFRRI